MAGVADFFHYAWSTRRAWWFTATARSQARFARTTLGGFWIGLSTLFSIGALATVYSTVFNVGNFQQYIVFLGTGLVIWNLIAASIGSAPTLFEYNSGRLKNTNTNPIFYSLEEWAFQIQTFAQSFFLILLVLSFWQPALFFNLVRAGLFPLLNLALFVYWMPLLLCLLGARYRDLYQLVPIALQLIFLLSPILYEKESLGHLAWIADFNPFFQVLSPLRYSLIHGSLQPQASLILFILNIAGIWIALWLLKAQRRSLPFLV